MGGNRYDFGRGGRGGITVGGGRRRAARRRLATATTIFAVAASGIVTVGSDAAWAAEITTAPERLYMAPEGTTLLAELVGVPIGTLPFDGGTDLISQDIRSLVVDTVNGDAGCDLTDQPLGVFDYDIDDCSRIQIDVGHGRLHMGAISTEFRDYITDPNGDPNVAPNVGDDNPGQPVYFLPSGAVIDNEYQTPDGSLALGINGTPQQLNDALADLVYTPDDGYWYVGSNPENMNVVVVPGNSDDVVIDPPGSNVSDSLTVEIRVLDVNDFPTLSGPDPAVKSADAQLPLVISNEYTVADEDNDEIVDDNDDGNPPPLPDGADSDMLLIGWLSCGTAPAPGTGFHFGSSVFQSDDLTIDDLLAELYPISDNPDYQLVIDALVAGLDAIAPELKDQVWATSSPVDFTTAFAGVSDIGEIQDALNEVTFLHNTPNDTCELVTVVTDLGNNGLPLQYVGTPFPADPLNDPFGIEVPFFGFDFHVLTINTGDLTEIDVSFEDASLFAVSEALAPIAAKARIRITPATHPEFTIRWDAVPVSATPGSDYAGTSNNTLVIGENVEFIPLDPLVDDPAESPITTNVFPDNSPEQTEYFTYEIITNQVAPPSGFTVTSTTSQKTVAIIDDETPDVTDPAVTIDQGAGQSDPTVVSPIVFDVVFSEPVVGFADGDVMVGGTAGATTAVVTGTGPGYTVSVSGMTQDGTVTASIAASVVSDAAGNPNEASTSTDNQVTFDVDEGDVTDPTVTINQAIAQVDPTDDSPIVFTAVFSEPVFGFDAGDVTVTGTAGATTAAVSGAGPAYTVTVSTMTQAGTVVVSIAGSVATDAAGNPNAASTSVDNVVTYAVLPGPLTLNLPGPVTRNNDPGQAGAVVNYPTVTAAGGVPPVAVVCTPAAGSFFPLGATTVTCVATDAESAQQQGAAIVTGTFLVTVVDAEAPVIADLPDLVRTTVGTTPVLVTFPLPTATDNSGAAPVVTCTPASSSTLPVGTTAVLCTAVDGAGNAAASSFTVTVSSSGSGGLLPATGGDIRTLVLTALLLLGAGVVFVQPRRRSARR